MMKQLLQISALAAGLLVVGCQTETQPESKLEDKSGPYDHFFFQRSYPDAAMDIVAFDKASDKVRKSLSNQVQKNISGNWTSQGPGNIGGRFNCLAVHPDDEMTVLAGSAAGGIFKTVNNGFSWYPVADEFAYLAIGCITYDPLDANIIYAGTGDPNISGLPHIGDGVYKSYDGGESWEHMGLTNQRIISRIVINPLNTSEVYAGTMGLPFDRNDDRGLYKSEDAGETWTQVHFVNDESGVIDLLINPEKPDTLFAAMWNRIRNNQESLVHGPDAKVWRSVDAGDSWEILDNGLPQDTASRIGLAMSSSNPDHLFALYVGTDYQIEGLYQSMDAGDSWQDLNWDFDLMNNALGGFGWYFGQIRVNPWNDEHITILGVDMYSTFDGGDTWQTTVPPWWDYSVHADKHDLVYVDENSVIIATDGGLYRSDDNMATWFDIENIHNSQFYRIGINPHNPGTYTGGAQDNGTTTGNLSVENNWFRDYGGDGFQPVYDPDISDYWYTGTQNGNLVFFDGSDWNGFTGGIDSEDRNNWDTPLIMSAHSSEVLYTGTHRVYANTNAPWSLWTPISEDLTDGVIFGSKFHTITTVGESRVDPDILYAGTTDANVWRTTNGGGDWTNITGDLPERYVTNLKTSSMDPNVVYVTFSGYKDNDNTPHVFRSDDLGDTWINISGDLPDLPINHIEVHSDENLIVATDFGVYATSDTGQTWGRVGDNMPLIPVFDIEIDTVEAVLVAGTFARSIMTFPLDSIFEEPIITDLLEDQSSRLMVFPNPVSNELNLIGGKPGHLTIYSMTGQLVYQTNWKGDQLDVSSLSGGEYLIQLSNNEAALRFIKK